MAESPILEDGESYIEISESFGFLVAETTVRKIQKDHGYKVLENGAITGSISLGAPATAKGFFVLKLDGEWVPVEILTPTSDELLKFIK